MRRAQAIFIAVTLLLMPLTPAACASSLSESDCCSGTICPLHSRPAGKQTRDATSRCDEMPARTHECAMKWGCQKTTPGAILLSLVKGVLRPALVLPMPAAVLWSAAPLPTSQLLGFHSPPFEPPRS